MNSLPIFCHSENRKGRTMKKMLFFVLVVFTCQANDEYFTSIPKKFKLQASKESTGNSYGFKTTETTVLEYYTLAKPPVGVKFQVSCSDESILDISTQENGTTVILPLKKGSTQLRMSISENGMKKFYSETVSVK